jgi:hypothetical protein
MRKQAAILVLSSLLCLGAAALNIWGAVALSAKAGSVQLRALVVPDVQSADMDFQAAPITMPAFTQAQREDLLKKVIREYVVARYTITGSNIEYARIFGARGPFPVGVLFYLPSMENEQPLQSLAAEEAERKTLASAHTTRTVEILGEPRRYKEMWLVDAMFIDKSPSVWRIADAVRKKYQIQMIVDGPADMFRTADSAMKLGLPSAVFDWRVRWIKRVEE